MIGEIDADVIFVIHYAAEQVKREQVEFEQAVDQLVLNLKDYDLHRDDISRELELAIAAPPMNKLNATLKALTVSVLAV